jgi:hypothetical protein
MQQAHRESLGQSGATELHLKRWPGQESAPVHINALTADVSSGQHAIELNSDEALRHVTNDATTIVLVATQVPLSHEQQAGMALEASSDGIPVTLDLQLTLVVENDWHEERCQVAMMASGAAARGLRPADASTNTRSRPAWPTW